MTMTMARAVAYGRISSIISNYEPHIKRSRMAKFKYLLRLLQLQRTQWLNGVYWPFSTQYILSLSGSSLSLCLTLDSFTWPVIMSIRSNTFPSEYLICYRTDIFIHYIHISIAIYCYSQFKCVVQCKQSLDRKCF